MKRLRYVVFDHENEMRDGYGSSTLTGQRQRQRRFIYHGTSIMYDAMKILYTQKINDTTTTTTVDDNHSTSIPSSLLHEAHKECDDIYVTACTLFHRYYGNSISNSCRRNSRSDGNNHHHNDSNQLRDSKSRIINNDNNDDNNNINDDDDDFDDVWSVCMACLLLAYKLHDISTNQISISDIIYTFCIVIYRQRILLPNFIPTIPTTTTTNTTTATIDIIALQKEYYTNNILPFVPNKWQQLSTVEQQQHVFHQPSDTTTTTNTPPPPPLSFLSKSGPLYTEWYNAIVQMECQILYTLQYRIYDIPDRPSIYSYIPILAQRYIDGIPPFTSNNNNKNNNTGSGTLHSPTHLLSSITTQAYMYCRLAVQIITWNDHPTAVDDIPLKVDHHDVTIPQIIACACLYCSVTTLGVEDDTIQNTNHLVTNHNNPGTTRTDHQGRNDGIHSEIWKLLLFPDRINPPDKKLWLSIQNEIDSIINMLHRTIQDPDYYIAQSNYCLFASTATTTSMNSFHGPDSFTWHRCIANIV